eukprot:6174356-Pleurochrysis_carterae.AAC.3
MELTAACRGAQWSIYATLVQHSCSDGALISTTAKSAEEFDSKQKPCAELREYCTEWTAQSGAPSSTASPADWGTSTL